MKYFKINNLLVVSFLSLLLLPSCDETIIQTSPPPTDCHWYLDEVCVFYNWLRIPNTCANTYLINANITNNCWTLNDACEYATRYGLDFKLVWSTIGTMCTESTASPQKKIITSGHALNNNGGFTAICTQDISISFIEHELIVQVGDFQDPFSECSGILLWEQMYTCTRLSYDLDITPQFVQVGCDREIYVEEVFQLF